MKRLVERLLIAAIVSVAAGDRLLADQRPSVLFDVPEVKGIVIDGKADDWENKGLQVPFLGSPNKPPVSLEDFSVSLRLGWNSTGLLALVEVTDDMFCDVTTSDQFWKRDRLEVFAGSAWGCTNYYQLFFSPGMSPAPPENKWFLNDYRQDKTRPMQISAARAKTQTGYAFEIFTAWSSLQKSPPKTGDEMTLQVCVYDSDVSDGRPVDWSVLAWYPKTNTSKTPLSMQRLKLSDRASPPWLIAQTWGQATAEGVVEPSAAEAFLKRTADTWPDVARIRYELGYLYLNSMANNPGAISNLNCAIELSRKSGDTFLGAESLFRLSMTDDNIGAKLKILERALEALGQDDSFEARYLRTRLLFSRGFYVLEAEPGSDKGLKQLEDAYEQAKKNEFTEFYPQIEGAMGRYCLAKNRNEDAKKHFETMRDMTQWDKERAYAQKMLAAVEKPAGEGKKQ